MKYLFLSIVLATTFLGCSITPVSDANVKPNVETNDPFVDEDKAKKLLDLITETGSRKTSIVPYAHFMDVKLEFE